MTYKSKNGKCGQKLIHRSLKGSKKEEKIINCRRCNDGWKEEMLCQLNSLKIKMFQSCDGYEKDLNWENRSNKKLLNTILWMFICYFFLSISSIINLYFLVPLGICK